MQELDDNEPLSAAEAAKIVRSSDFDALSRARAGVATAQRSAEGILAKAREEAEAIKAAALEQGRRESAALSQEHASRIKRDLAGLEERLISIVTVSLRRVLDPIPPHKLIAAAVRSAMSEIDLGRGSTLLVAPSIAPDLKDTLQGVGLGEDLVEVIGDPNCPANSSILCTPYGDLELGVEAQLQALEQGLRDAREQGGAL